MVREGFQGGTRIGLHSVFLHKRYIHSYSFYLPGYVHTFLNFYVGLLPLSHFVFSEMPIRISHSHFVPVAFVLFLVFQIFDRMKIGGVRFRGIRWYLFTAPDPQIRVAESEVKCSTPTLPKFPTP